MDKKMVAKRFIDELYIELNNLYRFLIEAQVNSDAAMEFIAALMKVKLIIEMSIDFFEDKVAEEKYTREVTRIIGDLHELPGVNKYLSPRESFLLLQKLDDFVHNEVVSRLLDEFEE